MDYLKCGLVHKFASLLVVLGQLNPWHAELVK